MILIPKILEFCLKCTLTKRSSNLFKPRRTSYHAKKTLTTCQDEPSPLKGIRVLDMTRVLAGPYCTMILGDLGAEVLKIEKLEGGDDTRSWGPPFVGDLSCYFACLNRNKQSVALDIKKGSHLVIDLATKCDVLVENFIPGTLEKLGIGYDELRRHNPGLVYCSITGYGPSGPYAKRGGYDVIAASIGGLLHITGPENGPPCKVGVAMTDIATGLYAHGAIMAALFQRFSTGMGQKVNCDLLSTQVATLVNVGSNYLNAGGQAERLGTSHKSIVPYQSFRTKDNKWITLGAGNNKQFHEICEALHLTTLKHNPLFKTNELRVANRSKLVHILETKMQSKTCQQWLSAFETCQFPFGPVNDMEETFNDPQVLHNNLVRNVSGYKIVGPPVKYSYAKNQVRLPPPELGAHTRHVLSNVLKYNDYEIERLQNEKIIQT